MTAGVHSSHVEDRVRYGCLLEDAMKHQPHFSSVTPPRATYRVTCLLCADTPQLGGLAHLAHSIQKAKDHADEIHGGAQ